jgi:hypothetical protein
MTVALLVVCEDYPDYRVASGLADRIIRERCDWIEPEVIDDYRLWRGVDDSRPFLTWSEAAARASTIDRLGVGALGHFSGKPAEAYAGRGRRTLFLLQALELPLGGVVLLIDDDGDTDRLEGLKQARAASPLDCPVVIGVAHLKRECWVLAGFEPADEHERTQLARVLGELTFDPRLHAERLTAKGDGEVRSAKRVLRHLTGSAEREADCWLLAPLDALRTRGQATGLTAFLAEIETRFVPLFTPTPPG